MRSLSCLFLVAVACMVGCNDRKTDGPPPSRSPDSPPTSPGGPLTSPGKAGGPATPAAGLIQGKPFTPDRVILEGRRLTFRKGKDFFAEMEISFELPKDDRGKVEEREWKLGGEVAESPIIQVTTRVGDALPKTEFAFPQDYSMTLRLEKQAKQMVSGSIDLRVNKPANTHLSGTFTATVKKTVQDPLDADDAPYVQGKITLIGDWQLESLAAGFAGKGADGNVHSNSAGVAVKPGFGTFATSTTFDPQNSSLINDEKTGPAYRHVKMPPGEYVVYVTRNNVLVAWKNLEVKSGDQLTADLTIDLNEAGTLVATLPDEEANGKEVAPLSLTPESLQLPGGLVQHYMCNAAEVKAGSKTVTVKGVPAGKYRVRRGKSEGEVEVVAGKETAVTLKIAEPKK
jgi:hypothetical protein